MGPTLIFSLTFKYICINVNARNIGRIRKDLKVSADLHMKRFLLRENVHEAVSVF